MLATDLTAALAFNSPKVMIPATEYFPYFSFKYSIISPLLSIHISESMSGIPILSGFKNLSNGKLYFIGSISVIPNK